MVTKMDKEKEIVTICNRKTAPVHSLWRNNRLVTKILIIEKYELIIHLFAPKRVENNG